MAGYFYRNIITDNEAGSTGGGIDLDNDSSVLPGDQVANNRAGEKGGGIYGSLFPWDGASIEGVTVTGNQAPSGGGIMLEANFVPVSLRQV